MIVALEVADREPGAHFADTVARNIPTVPFGLVTSITGTALGHMPLPKYQMLCRLTEELFAFARVDRFVVDIDRLAGFVNSRWTRNPLCQRKYGARLESGLRVLVALQIDLVPYPLFKISYAHRARAALIDHFGSIVLALQILGNQHFLSIERAL